MLDKVLKLSEKDLEKCRINPKDYLNNEQEQSTKKTEKETVTPKKRRKNGNINKTKYKRTDE